MNIFEDAYNLLLNKYILPKYSYKSNIDLFIDTANISNKYGQELAKFGQNKKKKVTKISLITSHDKIPLSVSFYAGNIHDVKTIEPSLSHITNKLKYNNINLIGDKGYISNDIKQKLKHININLVTYSKANQKIKNSSYELTLLSTRYKIEHANQILKDFNRIYLRRDKLLITYKSFAPVSL